MAKSIPLVEPPEGLITEATRDRRHTRVLELSSHVFSTPSQPEWEPQADPSQSFASSFFEVIGCGTSVSPDTRERKLLERELQNLAKRREAAIELVVEAEAEIYCLGRDIARRIDRRTALIRANRAAQRFVGGAISDFQECADCCSADSTDPSRPLKSQEKGYGYSIPSRFVDFESREVLRLRLDEALQEISRLQKQLEATERWRAMETSLDPASLRLNGPGQDNQMWPTPVKPHEAPPPIHPPSPHGPMATPVVTTPISQQHNQQRHHLPTRYNSPPQSPYSQSYSHSNGSVGGASARANQRGNNESPEETVQHFLENLQHSGSGHPAQDRSCGHRGQGTAKGRHQEEDAVSPRQVQTGIPQGRLWQSIRELDRLDEELQNGPQRDIVEAERGVLIKRFQRLFLQRWLMIARQNSRVSSSFRWSSTNPSQASLRVAAFLWWRIRTLDGQRQDAEAYVHDAVKQAQQALEEQRRDSEEKTRLLSAEVEMLRRYAPAAPNSSEKGQTPTPPPPPPISSKQASSQPPLQSTEPALPEAASPPSRSDTDPPDHEHKKACCVLS